MTDRAFPLKAHDVRALLAGTKLQHRMVLKPQPSDFQGAKVPPAGKSWVNKKHGAPFLALHDDLEHWCWWDEYANQGPDWFKVPFAKGDRLYVRETWTLHDRADDVGTVAYRATMQSHGWTETTEQIPAHLCRTRQQPFQNGWRPSIHMPRWASRLTLEVSDVRVERLQDISPEDAQAEGVFVAEAQYAQQGRSAPRNAFAGLWESINGAGSWDANPFVVAVSFTVHRGNIDQLSRAS